MNFDKLYEILDTKEQCHTTLVDENKCCILGAIGLSLGYKYASLEYRTSLTEQERQKAGINSLEQWILWNLNDRQKWNFAKLKTFVKEYMENTNTVENVANIVNLIFPKTCKPGIHSGRIGIYAVIDSSLFQVSSVFGYPLFKVQTLPKTACCSNCSV